MSNPFSLPSQFTSPLVTSIPNSRYDCRGRQLSFEESNVQQRERLAFANAFKSTNASPIQSPSSSSSGSPTQIRRPLISEPFSDPIEHMANRLAYELFDADDLFSFEVDCETPPSPSQHRRRHLNAALSYLPTSTQSSSNKTSIGSFHTRMKNTLSLIPEEE